MPVAEQTSDVLQKFCHGDPEAFEALFRRYQSEVYGWIFRIFRDPAAAEELTVEAFWRIHRAHARFDPGRGFEPWARRIATNAAPALTRRESYSTVAMSTSASADSTTATSFSASAHFMDSILCPYCSVVHNASTAQTAPQPQSPPAPSCPPPEPAPAPCRSPPAQPAGPVQLQSPLPSATPTR